MKRGSPLKRLYRLPMDLLEEVTTSMLYQYDSRLLQLTSR